MKILLSAKVYFHNPKITMSLLQNASYFNCKVDEKVIVLVSGSDLLVLYYKIMVSGTADRADLL